MYLGFIWYAVLNIIMVLKKKLTAKIAYLPFRTVTPHAIMVTLCSIDAFYR